MPDLRIKVGSQSGVLVLSTDLNSLASGSGSALSAAIDNAANGDVRAWLELNFTPGSAPTDGGAVEAVVVYLNSDGTNWGDYAAGASPVVDPNTVAGLFYARAAAAAHRRVTLPFALRARSLKIAVVNRCGVAFPASGSSVRLFTEQEESV